MIEWLRHIIAELNNYAGLFSLLAVIVAILGIYVSVRIHRSKKEEELQQMQDELDVRTYYQGVAAPTDAKEASIRKEVLKKAIKRGRR